MFTLFAVWGWEMWWLLLCTVNPPLWMSTV